MAKGRKTGGKDFEKGHEFHPGTQGRPPVLPEIKKTREMNATELVRILNELIHLDKEQLIARSKEAGTSVFELIICSILQHAYNKGDQQRINFILDRLVGKTKDQIEHTANGFRIVIEDYSGKEK